MKTFHKSDELKNLKKKGGSTNRVPMLLNSVLCRFVYICIAIGDPVIKRGYVGSH